MRSRSLVRPGEVAALALTLALLLAGPVARAAEDGEDGDGGAAAGEEEGEEEESGGEGTPAEAAPPAEAEQPAEAAPPAEAEQPAEAAPPAEAEQPAEAGAPVSAAAASGPLARPWIGVGLVVDFLFPSGRPASGSLAAGQTAPSGDRGFALPLLLSIRGYLRLSDMFALSPGVEIGWFRLSGDGHQDLPNDPDFTSFDYSYHIDNLPIFAGAALVIDPLPDWPLHVSVGGGFATLHAWAQTRYDPDGQPKVTSKVQSDWGYGWYVGVEASYSLWLGRISLEYRYSSARTDLEFQDVYSDAPYNSDLGDLQGSHLMLGYRFDLPW